MYEIPRRHPSTLVLTLSIASASLGCETRESEYLRALPDRDSIEISIPAPPERETRALQGEIGSVRSNLVGQPADLYSSTYYEARKLNALAGLVAGILDAITRTPPTTVDETSATWGPFGEPEEPNEFLLRVQRDAGSLYTWAIRGKHKSQGDDAYLLLAGGAFEPSQGDDGRGWFAVDFDAVHRLDPSEEAHGRIAYAVERNRGEVTVLARFNGRDDRGNAIRAGYAYGRSPSGNGFIVFAFPGDIHDGGDGKGALEDILIRTRWRTTGGRADVIATNGDLGTSVALGSQCWDRSFVSVYESLAKDGDVLAESGTEEACVFEAAKAPQAEELPDESDVTGPIAGAPFTE